MILFFGHPNTKVFAVQVNENPAKEDIHKLSWLFGSQPQIQSSSINGDFIGPRAAMITPWSTNAVEITQNMAIQGIVRIEEYHQVEEDFTDYDPMLSQKYNTLNQELFDIHIIPEAILEIENIAKYNASEGLSLNLEEISYLESVSKKNWSTTYRFRSIWIFSGK